MPLTLYRRHKISCPVHKTKLSARGKRHYAACECPIWIYGHTSKGALMPRQSTGYTSMPEAEAHLASVSAKNKSVEAHGPKLSDCIKDYLDSRRHELGAKTYQHHALLLGRLKSYCELSGKFFARELTVDILERFKVDGLPYLADTSKSTAIAKLRCFLRDAFRRGWITEALVDKIKTFRAVYEQKEPFNDEEITRLLAGAATLNGGTHGFAAHPKTFRLLLDLMLETGMRVGDAIRFNPAATHRGEHMWVYNYNQQKHKKTEKPRPIEAYISDSLKTAIDKCKWLSKARPFYYGDTDTTNPTYLAQEVYERMKTIGGRCEVTDCRPHRLRDTFAVRMLLKGVPLEDVSRLLGHSSTKITETYYAKWTRARKVRLEGIVAQALMNT